MRITHRKEKNNNPMFSEIHTTNILKLRELWVLSPFSVSPTLYIPRSLGGETLELLPREPGYPSLEVSKAMEGPRLVIGRGVATRWSLRSSPTQSMGFYDSLSFLHCFKNLLPYSWQRLRGITVIWTSKQKINLTAAYHLLLFAVLISHFEVSQTLSV